VTDENEKWLKSEDGNEQYLLWMADLAERATKISKKEIQISKDGEILVPVVLTREELPMAVKRHPDFYMQNATTFSVEFKVKDIILSEIDSIAQKRNALKMEDDDDSEFLFSDEDIYREIEKAIIKDMCVKALQAKEFAIQSFEKATSYELKRTENGVIIIPNFDVEEVKVEVNKKKPSGFFRKFLDKIWFWRN